jgi:general secretion pathway protein C
MVRYVSWIANTILFVACGFLAADSANAIFTAVLSPSPTERAAPRATPPPSRRSWSEREIILTRNLFNASALAPTQTVIVEEPDENLEATKLPLTLLGTVAAADPSNAWATIEDLDDRKTLVVRVNDEVKSNAKVERIERRRVVLRENGKLRELALSDEDSTIAARPKRAVTRSRTPTTSRRRSSARNRSASAQRIRKLAENRYEVPREELEKTMRNPTALFSQAQIQPRYDGGEMVGMQINAIKPGSLFEEIGINSGDVITELNGISINSPEESARILAEFSEADQFTVVVEDDSGEPRTLNFTMPEE